MLNVNKWEMPGLKVSEVWDKGVVKRRDCPFQMSDSCLVLNNILILGNGSWAEQAEHYQIPRGSL